jgi:hypothetical protein
LSLGRFMMPDAFYMDSHVGDPQSRNKWLVEVSAMRARLPIFVLLFFGAELAASWWIWGRAPTDSLRVWYSSFWTFEAGRLHYWIPVFTSFLALGGVAWYALGQSRSLTTRWLIGSTLAVGLEVLTSILYWRSARSSDLRGLFQSMWYWHRVPQANDMGWPSFRIYMWNHLVPWAVVLLLGITLWLMFEKGAKNATQMASTPSC